MSLAGRGESNGRELARDVVRRQALACYLAPRPPYASLASVDTYRRSTSAVMYGALARNAESMCGASAPSWATALDAAVRVARPIATTRGVGRQGRRRGRAVRLRPRCLADARITGSTAFPKLNIGSKIGRTNVWDTVSRCKP